MTRRSQWIAGYSHHWNNSLRALLWLILGLAKAPTVTSFATPTATSMWTMIMGSTPSAYVGCTSSLGLMYPHTKSLHWQYLPHCLFITYMSCVPFLETPQATSKLPQVAPNTGWQGHITGVLAQGLWDGCATGLCAKVSIPTSCGPAPGTLLQSICVRLSWSFKF